MAKRKEFDYIIVGAGSAGCVLATRLTEDPAVNALVLEAGGMDRSLFFSHANCSVDPAEKRKIRLAVLHRTRAIYE